MKFKAPRDPNTKSIVEKLRDVKDGSICQVGSGECFNIAVEAHDDGGGGEFLVCREHLAEVYALGKLIAEMTPAQTVQFARAITKSEST